MKRRMAKAVIGLVLVATGAAGVRAYTLIGAVWPTNSVSYRVNTANVEGLNGNAIINDLQNAAAAWANLAQIQLTFAGTTPISNLGRDSQNVVLFRNEIGPASGVIAVTYTWFTGPTIVETDMVFYEGTNRYFNGTTGCIPVSGGLYSSYIQSIATHEFGHVLGLDHSTVTGATMWPSAVQCDTTIASLAPDDIAGIQALYPPAVTSACDVNHDGSTNISDVQLCVNQAIGVSACNADINLDGQCNVIDVQRVVNNVLGGSCVSL